MTLHAVKAAELLTELQPQQQRVVDKVRASGGLLALHGVGAGKGLASIAAREGLGVPAEYVVPAPLQENIKKEFVKHTGEVPGDVRVRSYEKAVRSGDLNLDGLVVFDEAHRGRNPGTGAADLQRKAREAKYRLLLTGTGVYNQPQDIAPLLNAAAGGPRLPQNPSQFKSLFVGEKELKPGWFDRLRGLEPVKVPVLKNKKKLVDAAVGYVDVHKSGTGPDFPGREDVEHHVPMSPRQLELYKYLEGQMPWYLRAKIHAGLPMTKREAQELNAFQGALRQVSNTPRPYVDTMTDDEELTVAPKIQRMVENLRAAQRADKNFRAYVYSNYLGGGLHPYARALDKAGIKYNLFTGETAPKDRARIVQEYNDGLAPVILASGAGSEGLDLKGTKLVQLMEPHWNDARLEQAVGRGIRYKSHAHLPDPERKVRVEKYYSVFPDTLATKLRLKKKDRAVEQYMREMSDVKGQLARQIMQAMQEASDKGTSQTAAIAKARAEAEAAQQMPKAASWIDVLADYPT